MKQWFGTDISVVNISRKLRFIMNGLKYIESQIILEDNLKYYLHQKSLAY